MLIKVLGTGCPKCKVVEENARKAVVDSGADAEVVKVTDVNDILEYNVMVTPALVIDEEVKASGRVPSVEEIRAWIEEKSQT